MLKKRDFLSVTDFTADETLGLLKRARETKLAPKGGQTAKPLIGKTVALLFDKPSLRTKVSFQVGIQELGGYSVFLSKEEVNLGEREPASDVAKVLSGYVDCIVARLSNHELLVDLAKYASIPVVNAHHLRAQRQPGWPQPGVCGRRKQCGAEPLFGPDRGGHEFHQRLAARVYFR